MLERKHREIIDKHALEKAESSLLWWRDRGAIRDHNTNEWITLNTYELNIMRLALLSMAEELTLNMPSLGNDRHDINKIYPMPKHNIKKVEVLTADGYRECAFHYFQAHQDETYRIEYCGKKGEDGADDEEHY